MAPRIGILVLHTTPMSIRIYVEKIRERLPAHGIESFVFDNPCDIPQADVYWDPRTGGGRAPTRKLVGIHAPLVVTLHDVAHLSLPWLEFYPTFLRAANGRFEGMRVARDWRQAEPWVSHIIVPSVVTRDETCRFLKLDPGKISVIAHGVDHDQFTVTDRHNTSIRSFQPYFLHISQYQKRKNVERLLAAYMAIPRGGRPRLVMKLIGYGGPKYQDGVSYLDGIISPAEIAALYAGAIAFVFPSLNEGFGLPVLEAMASGCPVITSKDTACAEVVGEAALLVDPYSVSELTRALQQMSEDEALRGDLVSKGLIRSQEFQWDKSAEAHAEVFKKVLIRR